MARILHAMFSPGLGGIETAFLHYNACLAQQGHEMLPLIRRNSPLKQQLTEPREIPLRNAYDPIAIMRTRKYIKNVRPDCIITHGNRANQLIQKANKSYNIRQLHVLHRYRFKHLEVPDDILCISKDLMKATIEAGIDASKLHHIPNMVPEADQPPPHSNIHTPPVIGFLGRLVPEKGADLLVEALQELQQQHFAFQALLAGDGPEKEPIESLIQKHQLNHSVKLIGWTDDVADFFSKIDLLCVPSRSESFGLVILEAWRYGTPVIATATNGPTELITTDKNGILVPKGDPIAMATAIQTAIQDPESLTSMAINGWHERQNYTYQAIGKRLNEILIN